jgi:hypothetical protein
VDPNAAWDDFVYYLRVGDLYGARHSARDLAGWFTKRGFIPPSLLEYTGDHSHREFGRMFAIMDTILTWADSSHKSEDENAGG